MFGIRRRLLGVVLVTALVTSASATSGATSAEAKVRCEPVGYVYPSKDAFYAIAGMRCSKRVNKIAVSGWLYAGWNDNLWEISKSCRSARFCFDNSPMFRNPPGRERWRMVFAAGFKEHWYSIPKYRGFNRYFWF